MTARTPVIAGNWKLNPAPEGAVALAAALRATIGAATGVERVVCPPFVYLAAVRDALAGSSIAVGAQDLYWQDYGAFTGEVSAPMLAGLCRYAIIGHSERRQYFGETDESVRLKTEAALRHGLAPIVCVGETLDERESGRTAAVLDRQVVDGLRGLDLPAGIILAYEPVWAIGTGRAATDEMANEAIGLIRRRLASEHGPGLAAGARILYGGSVNPANAAGLLGQPEIDGALVGGASLKADDFTAIVRAAG